MTDNMNVIQVTYMVWCACLGERKVLGHTFYSRFCGLSYALEIIHYSSIVDSG